MTGKKNTALLAGGILAAALLCVVGVLLFRGIRRFSDQKTKLQSSIAQLRKFYDQDPFPSEVNVEAERSNKEEMEAWYRRLTDELRKGQIEPVKKSPSTFVSLFSECKVSLLECARTNKTLLTPASDEFAFGFDLYDQGQLPPPDDVPKLTQQLIIISNLCKIVFDCGANELVSVSREVFEDSSEGLGGQSSVRSARDRSAATSRRSVTSRTATSARASSRRGARNAPPEPPPPPVEDELFSSLHFGLEFRAREATVFETLNRLARHPMFVVVTSVELMKESPDVLSFAEEEEEPDSRSEDGEAAPVAKLDLYSLPRVQRVVSGPKVEGPILVRIGLDVYRFRGVPPTEAAAEL